MRQNFLLIAGAYGVGTGLSETYISQKIYKKHDFIKKYRNDEVSVTINRYFELIDWFRENWPDDVPWPNTFPIPKLGKNSADDQIADSQAAGIS